ncbi:hypothetical protein [Coleofasciculus sp. B1-GNL1-01]
MHLSFVILAFIEKQATSFVICHTHSSRNCQW